MAIGKIHYVVIKKVNGKFIYFTYIILYKNADYVS